MASSPQAPKPAPAPKPEPKPMTAKELADLYYYLTQQQEAQQK